MNKYEKIMAEKMNFVSRRGRTAEYQKREWLRELRDRRRDKGCPCWTIFSQRIGWFFFFGSLNAAKIEAKKLGREFPNDYIYISHTATMVQVWENYKVD